MHWYGIAISCRLVVKAPNQTKVLENNVISIQKQVTIKEIKKNYERLKEHVRKLYISAATSGAH
jgi:hypothetical protein